MESGEISEFERSGRISAWNVQILILCANNGLDKTNDISYNTNIIS